MSLNFMKTKLITVSVLVKMSSMRILNRSKKTKWIDKLEISEEFLKEIKKSLKEVSIETLSAILIAYFFRSPIENKGSN